MLLPGLACTSCSLAVGTANSQGQRSHCLLHAPPSLLPTACCPPPAARCPLSAPCCPLPAPRGMARAGSLAAPEAAKADRLAGGQATMASCHSPCTSQGQPARHVPVACQAMNRLTREKRLEQSAQHREASAGSPWLSSPRALRCWWVASFWFLSRTFVQNTRDDFSPSSPLLPDRGTQCLLLLVFCSLLPSFRGRDVPQRCRRACSPESPAPTSPTRGDVSMGELLPRLDAES